MAITFTLFFADLMFGMVTPPLLMVASIYDTIFLSLWQEIFLDFSKIQHIRPRFPHNKDENRTGFLV